jgi:MIP family channel proteins
MSEQIRKCIAEFIGTFVIVFAPVALSGASHLRGVDSGIAAAAWVSGLSVMAMIYALGHISGAHFNPAVTLGFASAGRFKWRDTPGYWLAQFSGSVAASAVCALLFGPGFGAHVPSIGASIKAVSLEALLTFFLMFTIISLATDIRAHGPIAGLAIGVVVVLDVFIGAGVTGGSMNPARSLGPALFAGGAALSDYWVYVTGPCIGAVIASWVYEAIRGERVIAAHPM